MPFNVGLSELLVILVICLVIFGAGKLPGVGRALGQSIREFKESSQGKPEAARAGGAETGESGEQA